MHATTLARDVLDADFSTATISRLCGRLGVPSFKQPATVLNPLDMIIRGNMVFWIGHGADEVAKWLTDNRVETVAVSQSTEQSEVLTGSNHSVLGMLQLGHALRRA